MTFRAKKALVIIMGTIGFLSFGLQEYLFYDLMAKSPELPNIATGHIYPLNQHGSIVYITRNQSLLQDILLDVFTVFGFGAGYLNLRWKTIHNYFDDLPKPIQMQPREIMPHKKEFFLAVLLLLFFVIFVMPLLQRIFSSYK